MSGPKTDAIERVRSSVDVRVEVWSRLAPDVAAALLARVEHLIWRYVPVVERITTPAERAAWLRDIEDTAQRLRLLLARCPSVDYEDARAIYQRYTPEGGPVVIDGYEYPMVDPRYVLDALATAARERAMEPPRLAGCPLGRESATAYRNAMIRRLAREVRQFTGRQGARMVAALARAILADEEITTETVRDTLRKAGNSGRK